MSKHGKRRIQKFAFVLVWQRTDNEAERQWTSDGTSLTGLFGGRRECQAQIWIVFWIQSPLVFLSAPSHTVQTNSWIRRDRETSMENSSCLCLCISNVKPKTKAEMVQIKTQNKAIQNFIMSQKSNRFCISDTNLCTRVCVHDCPPICGLCLAGLLWHSGARAGLNIWIFNTGVNDLTDRPSNYLASGRGRLHGN